jgi:hypothetical protein
MTAGMVRVIASDSEAIQVLLFFAVMKWLFKDGKA